MSAYVRSFACRALLWGLLAGLALVSVSCVGGSEASVVESSDCYITGVTLGTVKLKDSSSSLAGSTVKMSIDQYGLRITNIEPLPADAVLDRVTATVNYVGGQLLCLPENHWEGDEWKLFDPEDTLDLSSPLMLKVIAANEARDERVYRFSLTRAGASDGEIGWELVDAAVGAAAVDNVGLVDMGGTAVLMSKAEGEESCFVRGFARGADGSWTMGEAERTNLSGGALLGSVCRGIKGEALYASDASGALYVSDDGLAWSRLAPVSENAVPGLRLVGVGADCLYCVGEGRLWRMDLASQILCEDSMDGGSGLIAGNEGALGFVSYFGGDVTNHLLLACRNEGAGCVDFWLKAWYDWDESRFEDTEVWMYNAAVQGQSHLLPELMGLRLVYFEGRVLALGYEAGSVENGVGDMVLWESSNHGLSWRVCQSLTVPDMLKGLDVSQPVSAVVDDMGRLWILAGGKLVCAACFDALSAGE